MLLAKLTIFLDFKPIFDSLFILVREIVELLTISTLQLDHVVL